MRDLRVVVCCGYDAEGAEREDRNRAERFRTFADRSKWRVSRNNNLWRQMNVKGIGTVTVTIYEKEGRFGVYLAGKRNDKHIEPPDYETQLEANERAFEIVDAAKNDEG